MERSGIEVPVGSTNKCLDSEVLHRRYSSAREGITTPVEPAAPVPVGSMNKCLDSAALHRGYGSAREGITTLVAPSAVTLPP